MAPAYLEVTDERKASSNSGRMTKTTLPNPARVASKTA
jgi:hypothetical protein